MLEPAEALLRQPLRRVSELRAEDFPPEPGIYAWYRNGELFYIGESHRGLRSRLWSNHLRGKARSSTLRNKVAKAFGFPPTGFRTYGPEAEKSISSKLCECAVRFLAISPTLIDEAQADLIREFDPPMNDHPGQIPRWRIDEIRAILEIGSGAPTERPVSPTRKTETPSMLARSQPVTLTDIKAGRIRFPREAKRFFPNEPCFVNLVLRGERLEKRYDPRTGPDRERSAVLHVGRANTERLVQPNEVLTISKSGDLLRLD